MRDFPILDQRIYRDRPLIYFDSGASSQRPRSVIQAMDDCYLTSYANVHRGLHYLSEKASAAYESARQQVQQFIGAEHAHEIIFTSGTTLAINTVARSWGDETVQPGDEILLTIMEHHSNIVPWQQLAARTGARIQFIGITADGHLDWDDFDQKLTDRTRMVSVSAVSNVLGTVVDIEQVVNRARKFDARVMVDAAQHVPHEPTDVRKWGADFVAFSGHKMLGPSGIGVLYGRQHLLEQMPPFLGGGSMIGQVTTEGFTDAELPAKFEAGTPPIAEAVGLGAAIDYLNQVGIQAIAQHERELCQQACASLSQIEGLRIFGPAPGERAGILSFVVDGLATQDLAIFLDRQGCAIRAGHHCAMPLHDHLGLRNSCRASFYLYNTADEVEQFVEALKKVIAKLR